MAANYLHGVETIEIKSGSRPVQVVKSAVIGLVGIAASGPKNQVILVSSDRDAAQFGSQVPGFTIAQSLDAIFAQGAGTVLVVNVFDETIHTTQVTDEAKTVTAGKLKLDNAPIGTVTVKDSIGVTVDYVYGTDYSIDEYGNFIVLSNEIPDNTALKFSYKKLNAAAVTATYIQGSYTEATGVRTGLKCFDTARTLFGFNPKVLIAPGFSTLSAVATSLISAAEKYRAYAYIDAPVGTTVADAIAGRGPSGDINFNTSNKRVVLCYPHLKKYDPATDSDIDFPFSAFLAGIRASADNSDGFWFSVSNREIKGTTGAEVDLSAGLSDSESDVNRLNEAGITTVFNSFGTGIRTWGPRNASFPSSAGADTFENIVRIDDVVSESIEQAALQFIDQPITQGLIDTIRESGNAFIRILIGRGALIPGSIIKYNKEDNTPAEQSNGHITFERVYMGPTPAERITYKSVLDITLLKNLA